MAEKKTIVVERTESTVPGAYDRSGAAAYLSIGRTMLDKLVNQGLIRRTFAGSKPLFRKIDLDAFLEKGLAQTQEANA